MNRNAFKQLLKRYVAGTATDEERALIDHWYELLYNEEMTTLNGAELHAIEQEMWQKIEQDAQLNTLEITPARIPIRKLIIRWSAAAAVLAAIGFGASGIFSSQSKSVAYIQSKEQNNLAEIINNTTVVKEIQLEDGTVILLQPLAKLAYPNHFSTEKREVYLEGEAFFNVAKNPLKPFLVHSGNIITQVLGTSFKIKPEMASGRIIVSVKTGRVAVFEDNKQLKLDKEQLKNNGTIITPNQLVIYDASDRNFATSLVENPEPVLSETDSTNFQPSFSFDETNLGSVMENVAKLYGIEILVENENIYQCRFTGNIGNQSLYEKLSSVCQATNLHYEIKGTKILITGKGCR